MADACWKGEGAKSSQRFRRTHQLKKTMNYWCQVHPQFIYCQALFPAVVSSSSKSGWFWIGKKNRITSKWVQLATKQNMTKQFQVGKIEVFTVVILYIFSLKDVFQYYVWNKPWVVQCISDISTKLFYSAWSKVWTHHIFIGNSDTEAKLCFGYTCDEGEGGQLVIITHWLQTAQVTLAKWSWYQILF